MDSQEVNHTTGSTSDVPIHVMPSPLNPSAQAHEYVSVSELKLQRAVEGQNKPSEPHLIPEVEAKSRSEIIIRSQKAA